MNAQIGRLILALAGILVSVAAFTGQAAERIAEAATSTSAGTAAGLRAVKQVASDDSKTTPARRSQLFRQRPVAPVGAATEIPVPDTAVPPVAAGVEERASTPLRTPKGINRALPKKVPTAESAQGSSRSPGEVRPGAGRPGRVSGTDGQKNRQGRTFRERGTGSSKLKLPQTQGGARWSQPGSLTGRSGAAMMKPESGGSGSGFAPRDPFVRNPDGAPRSTSHRAAPQEEGLSKDNDFTYGATRGSTRHSTPRDPFVRNPDGSARSASGGFAGRNKEAGAADPFVRNPDGSPRSTSGGFAGSGKDSDAPSYDGASDTYVYGDGRRVRGSDPQGRRGKVNPDGSIDYPDGTRVTRDSDSGTTTVMRPDGSTQTHASRGPRYEETTDTFVYGDDTRVRGSDPKGRRGKVNPDGSIDYPDGTRVRHDTSTGRTEIHRADGSTVVHDEHGGRLEAGPGTTTSRSESGGTTVHDSESGVTANFGPGESTYVQGGSKDDDGGEEGSGGSSKGSSSGGSDDSSSDSGGGDSDSDDSGDSDAADSGSDDSDSSDSGDSDGGSDDSGGDSDEMSAGNSSGGAAAPSPSGVARRTDPGYRERDGGCGEQPSGAGGPPDGTTQPGAGSESGTRGDCASGLRSRQSATGGGRPAVPVWSAPARSVHGKSGRAPSTVVNPDRLGGTGIGRRAYDPLKGVDARTNPAPGR